METKLTINDLPTDVVNQMKSAIAADEKVISLQSKKMNFLRCRDYIGAQKISSMISSIEIRVINQFLVNYSGQSERMDILMKDMSEADRESINIYTNATIFLCDIIETLSMESDQILKKYHPDYDLEMFDKISQVGKEAKAHMKFMSDNTDTIYQASFADGADDISELVLNKVKSFIKKSRRKQEWKSKGKS